MSNEAGHYLKTISDRGTAGNQAATFIVAASDSLHPERADYVCDGTDDQVQINAALAIGEVVLTKGTFYISAPIRMTESFSKLSGAGHGWNLGGTQIYLADGSNCNMIEMDGTDNRIYFPTICDLYLEGNLANNPTGGHGIYCPVTGGGHEVSDQMLYNVGIHGVKSDGIRFLGGWYITLVNVWCEVNGGCGTHIDAQTTITNSVFSANLGNGLELCTTSFLTNSSIERNTGHGILCYGGYSVINGCLINDNSNDSAGTNSGIVNWGGGDDMNISNNIIIGGAHQDYGIIIDAGVARCNVNNNNISGNVTAPIYLGVGNSAQVRDNIGFVTENSGTATLVNGQTAIVVAHGLAVTPVAGDIVVTPIEAWGSMTQFYIDTYTATQFTIHADQNPTQDVDFAWKAIVL